MKKYIFLTKEGLTYQPNSTSLTPDIDNVQVVGIVKSHNQEEAFYNLLANNSFLQETSFN